jgi:uncharacterized protein (DUF362 family)/Pyruvate/2-oxoacid:ferredoxin oxidoreductase delta subunit
VSEVVVLKCESYEGEVLSNRIEQGIGLLGGWDRFVHSGMKVLLKINLIGPKTPESSAVTHCEFVRAIGRILKAKGCEVWIGDSSGGAIAGIAPTEAAMDVSGMTKVAKEEGFVIKNFEREGAREVRPVDAPERVYHLATPAFEADLVINLPKLKTHSAGTFTGAVKNLFGCVPGLKKAEYHRIAPNTHDFGIVIADINRCIKPALNIMDGIVAMQGKGPTAGKPYPAKMLLMSTDPLALDTIACSMLGLKPEELPIFDSARERGIGEWRIDSIHLLGDFSKPPLLPNFDVPKAMKVGTLGGKAFGLMINFMKRRPQINLSKCRNCGVCIESCPVNAIDRATKAIDYSKCIECLCCHELCMSQAVELRHQNRLMGMISRK